MFRNPGIFGGYIKRFVSAMIQRGEDVKRKRKDMPPGIIVTVKEGKLVGEDAQTGKPKELDLPVTNGSKNDGVDMPVVFEQDELHPEREPMDSEPSKCIVCKKGCVNLHMTRDGWMCEPCIQKGSDKQDKIQRKAKPIVSALQWGVQRWRTLRK